MLGAFMVAERRSIRPGVLAMASGVFRGIALAGAFFTLARTFRLVLIAHVLLPVSGIGIGQ